MQPQITTCSIDGCERRAISRSWCQFHYNRWYKTGDTGSAQPTYIRGNNILRFWSRTDPCRTDNCWVWVGDLLQNGYGRIQINGRGITAHSFLIGRATRGLEWDHLCRNRTCVNPSHLEAVSHSVNVRRGVSIVAVNAQKTHCKRGHEFTETNTRPRKDHPGRTCRECTRIAMAQIRARRKHL